MVSKKLAWEMFDYWFKTNGHWMFGIGDKGKLSAEAAWKQYGIDGLPDYPGKR